MLSIYEVIKKKRDGGRLSKEEIEFMVSGFVRSEEHTSEHQSH